VIFAIRIDLSAALALEATERELLVSRERARAAELVQSGVFLRIWRVGGAPWENLIIARAESESDLRGLIRTLPLFPWMATEITRLSTHESDPLEGESDGGVRYPGFGRT